MKRLILWALWISFVVAAEWDASNFPNPTAGQFKECRLKTAGKVCDPDSVLDEAGRNRLDYELQMLETRTRQDNARTFCEKKGVTAAMAVAKHIKGGSTEGVKAMANDMLRRWTLDPQCQKAIVIVVSTDDAKFWVARDDKVPVYADEFTEMFMQQKKYFKEQQYVQALRNILQGTWEKALSKQGSPKMPSGGGNVGGGGQRPVTPGFDNGRGQGGQGAKKPEFKMPQIPSWVWLVLVFGVIPLLCCCLCCYCCCCRGKGGGGGGRTAVPQDGPADGMGGGGSAPRGGGRSPFGNFMSTVGGAGVGSMIGNFLSNRNRGGGGGMGMGGMGGGGYGGGGSDYQGGGAYPAEPQPVYDDNNGQGGGGLYPSVAVKDEGGGGSWA